MTDPITPQQIVGTANTADRSYWLSHPDVESVEVAPQADGGFEHRLWLRPAPERGEYELPPEPPRTVKPDRGPDIELMVEGAPHPTFVSRLPRAEHIEHYIEGMPDEAAPYGWWFLRVWLADDGTGRLHAS